MKIIVFCLATVLFSLPAYADEWTYSDVKPQIQRLQGVILCPVEISIGKAPVGADQYKYKTIRVEDTGQAVHQNRAVWVEDNKDLMSDYLYGETGAVFRQILDGRGESVRAAGAAKLTEAKKPSPTIGGGQ